VVIEGWTHLGKKKLPSSGWKLDFFGDGSMVIMFPTHRPWLQRKVCEFLFGSKWIKL